MSDAPPEPPINPNEPDPGPPPEPPAPADPTGARLDFTLYGIQTTGIAVARMDGSAPVVDFTNDNADPLLTFALIPYGDAIAGEVISAINAAEFTLSWRYQWPGCDDGVFLAIDAGSAGWAAVRIPIEPVFVNVTARPAIVRVLDGNGDEIARFHA